ncbi:MAG: hypothetical protein AAF560_12910 [Acidobacteriota bacterium]
MRWIALLASFLVAAPVLAQAGRPAPLPSRSTLTDIGSANRERDALGAVDNIVARLFIRMDSHGDVTTSFVKSRPEGFFYKVSSDGGLKWKSVSRSAKPKRTEGRPGYTFVGADWNASNHRRHADCHADLQPGMHQVLFIWGSDTTDEEGDNFVCRFAELAVPAEDVKAWADAIAKEQIETFNACSEASGNQANAGFWACVDAGGIALPPLTKEMTARLKG